MHVVRNDLLPGVSWYHSLGGGPGLGPDRGGRWDVAKEQQRTPVSAGILASGKAKTWRQGRRPLESKSLSDVRPKVGRISHQE